MHSIQQQSEERRVYKAVALISGGLDSMLAVRVMQEQGIYVEGINFFTGFCVEGHTHAIRSRHKEKPKRNNALWVAETLGIKLHIIDIVEEYKKIVLKPKYGYGSNLNPCLDCKIFMVGKAYEWMQQHEFDFIITGEVIGQRPKSQVKKKLPIVAEESGAYDRLLRPLCAQLLPETLPERMGWVDRNQLKDFHGRSRAPQIALADQYGIEEFAQPAGGCCFLTDEHYAKKLRDLWHSQGTRDYDLEDIILLKVGRHVRPAPHYKLIIGRDAGENQFLRGYRKQFIHLTIESHEGSLVLIDGKPCEEELQFACRIAARYSQGRSEEVVSVKICDLMGNERVLSVKPLLPEAVEAAWLI